MRQYEVYPVSNVPRERIETARQFIPSLYPEKHEGARQEIRNLKVQMCPAAVPGCWVITERHRVVVRGNPAQDPGSAAAAAKCNAVCGVSQFFVTEPK